MSIREWETEHSDEWRGARSPDREAMEPQHVEHSHLCKSRAEELWRLVDTRGHQQTTVTAAHNGHLIGSHVPIGDKILGGVLEVVKHVLLLLKAFHRHSIIDAISQRAFGNNGLVNSKEKTRHLPASQMPVFSILATSSDIRYS